MEDSLLNIPSNEKAEMLSRAVIVGGTGSAKQSNPSASLRETVCAATGQLDLFSKCPES